jgi:hypothetical protein
VKDPSPEGASLLLRSATLNNEDVVFLNNEDVVLLNNEDVVFLNNDDVVLLNTLRSSSTYCGCFLAP